MYDADENLRFALIHLIQTIGEAGRQVSREFCDNHPEIRWADIIGMRHKVVHDVLRFSREGAPDCFALSRGVDAPSTAASVG